MSLRITSVTETDTESETTPKAAETKDSGEHATIALKAAAAD